MSMQVPVELLPEVVRGYGQSAYAVVSDPAGPPLSVLWPAVHAETMSLIVDADVLGVSTDGTVTVRAAAAVRHRPAPQPESHDSMGCASGD